MRVLSVSQLYPRRSNGSAGIFIHRLHRELATAGVTIEVLQQIDSAPPWPLSSLRDEWRRARFDQDDVSSELDGVSIHHPKVWWPRPSRFFRANAWGRRARSLIHYAKNNKNLASSDVILAHFMVPDGYHAVVLGRALGIPVAVMAWGDDLHAWPEQRADWRQRLRFVLRHADLLIACSKQMVDDGNRWLDAARSDWEVVYAGVDLERFSPATVTDRGLRGTIWRQELGEEVKGARILLMLARATAAKGYLDLLEAWAQLDAETPNWHLVMVGDDGDLNVAAEVARRGLTSRAHWLGPKPPSAIPGLLRASDAFVLPSHNEGLSLSVLEALATGLPTVTTRVGGHAEVITTESEGWLISPRSVPELKNALRKMLITISDSRAPMPDPRRAAERIGSPRTNARKLSELLLSLAQNTTRDRSVIRTGA